MFDIENYFENFVKTNKIFEERNILRPEFVPKILPHRDIQIRKIAEIVACTLKNSKPSNIFVFGKTGTGKTAVINYVKDHLNNQCRNSKIHEPKWVSLNCQQVNTGYRVLARICNEIDPYDPVPIAGWPIDVVFDKLIEKLDTFVHGICFIILDEIDILVKKMKKSNDILYNLARINSQLKHAKVNIIGISNVLNFKNSLDPRVLSSLGEEEIVFPAYNANELKEILNQRANSAFQNGALSLEIISLCAALAAKEHGDARKALDLLRKAGELAERRQSPKITPDFVYFAQDDIEKDKMKEYCESLPLQNKTILLSIYSMQKYRAGNSIITGDVYSCYLELQKQIPGLSKLSQRRVSEIIRELDLSGILNAQIKSNGRYGRTKFINLNIPLEDLNKFLIDEQRLNNLFDYRPKCIESNITCFKGQKYVKLV